MKRILLFLVYVLSSATLFGQGASGDYIPFVEIGKTWHVVSSVSYNQQNYHFFSCWMNEEVERDGRTYIQLRQSMDDLTEPTDAGLFREENRRVYKYIETENKEVLLYDFSLIEGDTFTYELEPGIPENCKVMKQGYFYDGPQIVSSITRFSTDSLDFNYRRLRTWTIGVETNPRKYREIATWVEGVGSLVNTFCPSCVGGINSLAYIERNNDEVDITNNYLPFSFYNMYGLVHGCDMPTSKADYTGTGDRHHLTYELVGDRLQVSGRVLTRGGRNNYAYFIEEPTDDPLVRKLHFEIQAIEPLPDPIPGSDGLTLHDTYFCVTGFNPNMSYIVVDNQGEEHPVVNRTPQNEYRPMVEDGKVWKVGDYSGNPVQRVEYYYFDGDTTIDGKVCKQMMCQRYVSPEHPDYAVISQQPSLSYVGAWYEEDKKVYLRYTTDNAFRLMYDFSLEAYDTLQMNNQHFIIGPRQTGGLNGFKGAYRNLANHRAWKTTWLEGVGGIDGPTTNVNNGKGSQFLMSCTVGDEVIYLNDKYEDGATPAEARKSRFDFTHTTKPRPKAPKKVVSAREQEGEMQSLYGEYNDQQLRINLAPLDEAYLVRITNESGKAIYEKAINAGTLVGLNIDISAYAKGRYTVTVENSRETFTGLFEIETAGIADVRTTRSGECGGIYNLQGQRISTLQKGLNIVNGRKIVVR